MTLVHYNPPPQLGAPVAGDLVELCLICLMNAKGEQVTATRDQWQPLMHDGKDARANIPFDVKVDIRPAVTNGICDMFPGLLMPLCWDHLGAIAPADPRPVCSWCNGSGFRGVIEPASSPLRPGTLPPGLGGNGSHKRGHG